VLKNDLLEAAFGPDHVLGALANMSGELLPSGEVLFTRNVSLQIGALRGGVPEAVRALAQTIDSSGVRSAAVPNIADREWSKFAAWAGMAGVSITTRAVTWKYLMDPDAALVLVRLIREVRELATRAGARFTDDVVFPVATLCTGTEEAAVRLLNEIGAHLRDHSPNTAFSAPGHRCDGRSRWKRRSARRSDSRTDGAVAAYSTRSPGSLPRLTGRRAQPD
jgi:ketopantoate reductase